MTIQVAANKEGEGFILWFTGLSGAGKSTIANIILDWFQKSGRKVEILDGDIVRTNLSKGLGFSKEDRDTNIRRIGFVADLLARNGVAVIVAAISPYAEVRNEVRENSTNFVEVFINTQIETCIERDVKGLYKKALSGEIKQFTGISDPYEAPENPEINIKTEGNIPEESAAEIVGWLEKNSYLSHEKNLRLH